MSESFYIFQPGIPEGTRRPATPEERRFLKRYNLVRLWRMLLFWLLPLFLLGIIAMLHWLVLMLFPRVTGMSSVPALLLLLVPLLFLDWVYLKQWGGPLWQALRVRPILRVPRDLQVLEFEAPLGLVVHRTDHEVNIFTAGATVVDVPEHWEDEVLRRAKARTNTGPSPSRFVLASLPGTQKKVIRLPMNRVHMGSLINIKADILLRDIGDIVIGLGELSIQQEMQARLPVLRGHPGMLLIGGLFAFAAVVLALAGREVSDRAEQQQQRLQSDIARQTSRYLSGEPVDIAALQARGFEELAHMPGTQEKVVTGASFERLVAMQSRQGVPFLLSQAEWGAVQRASFATPRILPGSASIPPKRIEEYRQMLLNRLAGEGKELERVRTVIQDLPQSLVEGQLRALARGNLPDQAFIGALLPSPAVHPGEEGAAYPAGALCKEGAALCQAGLQAAVSWAEPAFIASAQGRIGVVHANDVARIFALQDELSAAQQAPGGETAKGWAAAFGIMTLMCFLLYWQASRRLKRYWRYGET